ncbi:putative xanthine dehydrogenase subunit A [Pelotomaculum schinkii]|uniref:Putative xanthine dehydrogenase subunit A n=1 Tax=Pelotomaculum schinkii TaxID=78350 RepID=A0A4Y7R6D9_9FIRM|nr:XdhC/CoxI family protein [Pelotomaculum schinkii]TEB04528.1 putative xanthine dehydrogenase subunit A [Pelotomaculum schinkii]
MEINLQQGIAVVTVIGKENLPGSLLGRKGIFKYTGEGTKGDLGLPWLEEQVAEILQNNQSNGMFKLATLSNPAKPEQSATVMIDPYLPPHELIILGGGHIAVPLVTIGKILGYQVTVVDDRHDFAHKERFPEADRVICCDFSDIEKRLAFGPGSSVVIITRGHQHDQECLRRLIKYPLAYLGMIGSRRKINIVRQQLLEEGIDAEKLEQVHMPVGLDVGAQTPGEVAVSIAAELLRECRGGSAHSLKDHSPKRVAVVGDVEMLSAVDREVLQKTLTGDETPAAVATIVKTRGSTPRKAGARMLVYADGRILGTIGGGCGESEVRLAALGVIDENLPRIYQVSLSADTAAVEGMVCGGAMEVYIEPVEAYKKVFYGGESND